MADVGLAMQRALDKTENMRSRASAMQELEASGTFDDLTTLGPGEDDIDRQLRELSSGSQVDDDLSKMKAELGLGDGAGQGALAAGSGSAEDSASASSGDASAPKPTSPVSDLEPPAPGAGQGAS
jgi:phage shock protein A